MTTAKPKCPKPQQHGQLTSAHNNVHSMSGQHGTARNNSTQKQNLQNNKQKVIKQTKIKTMTTSKPKCPKPRQHGSVHNNVHSIARNSSTQKRNLQNNKQKVINKQKIKTMTTSNT